MYAFCINGKGDRYGVETKGKTFYSRSNNNIVLAALISLASGIMLKANHEESNAQNYVYVSERICTVTDITEDCITVCYNGNEYAFFGYGYEEGQQIICQFTNDMEIVGVTE